MNISANVYNTLLYNLQKVQTNIAESSQRISTGQKLPADYLPQEQYRAHHIVNSLSMLTGDRIRIDKSVENLSQQQLVLESVDQLVQSLSNTLMQPFSINTAAVNTLQQDFEALVSRKDYLGQPSLFTYTGTPWELPLSEQTNGSVVIKYDYTGLVSAVRDVFETLDTADAESVNTAMTYLLDITVSLHSEIGTISAKIDTASELRKYSSIKTDMFAQELSEIKTIDLPAELTSLELSRTRYEAIVGLISAASTMFATLLKSLK